jgi:hypothetical protein
VVTGTRMVALNPLPDCALRPHRVKGRKIAGPQPTMLLCALDPARPPPDLAAIGLRDRSGKGQEGVTMDGPRGDRRTQQRTEPR